LCTLQKLHERGYVHGDVRVKNILFSYDGKTSYLIDFDLSRKRGNVYPPYYFFDSSVRHTEARSGNLMKEVHDLEGLKLIITHFFKDIPEPEATVASLHGLLNAHAASEC